MRAMTGRWARTLAVVVALALAGPAFAQTKGFVREDLASDGVRLEEQLRKEGAAAAANRQGAQLRKDGEGLLQRDPRRALALLTASLSADPKPGGTWLSYARASLAIDAKDGSERWRLRDRATVAAYVAYQRAAGKAEEAAALAVLGEVFAAREMWRPALDSYRASLGLVDEAGIRSTYQALREEHGFRVTDYKVDSDSASPRVCFQFSDPLARGKVDFAPYVAVSGAANAAVSVEEQQLCVDGLKHGERYAMVLRQGLPSSVGEALLKPADYEIYVRDRSPQVRFTGKNYVLPRVGQEGIPVVSVNTPRVSAEIVRVGDRNLISTVRSDDFLSQLESYKARQLADENGVKVWSGTLEVKTELNKDVVTAFPVLEALGKLEPGVYVMTARAEGTGPSNADDDYGTRATQWFVVSDLGLTAFSGDDGVHALLRSLASAEPLRNVTVRLIARNNEILSEKQTDETGHVAFDPGLSRGKGGMAPGLVVATDDKGDYGFLDLGLAAFDLTDRGVKGRTPPSGLDAFLYTERGVYRSGETVYLSTLLRDARGIAVSGLPLTLVAKRPDGVEYRRVVVEDQGLGGRAWSLPILPGASRGTWRLEAYADPKGQPIGETTFLVEDYVPERLELTLKPKRPAIHPGEPAEIDLDVRYLYGAPGANLDVSGEYVIQPAETSGIPGLGADWQIGLQDESFENVSGEIEEHGTTNGQGKATMVVDLPEANAPKPVEARVVLRVGETGGRAIERSITIPILPKGAVMAVRKAFGELSEGSTATFDVAYVSPDGRRLPRKGATWTLSRIEKRYQWYNSDGRWGFEPVTSTRRVADGTLDIAADAPARIAAQVQWGAYRLDVRSGTDTGDASVNFTVGWSGDATAETPDLLEMSLDKPAYAAGDTMAVRLASRFDGKATLAVVSDRVRDLRVVDVKAGETRVELPVGTDWGAGAYLVALAHRPLDAAARRMPGRAIGVAWFAVDKAAHEVSVSLGTVAKMRPRAPLEVPVTLAGLAPGEEAFVTVAAVDVGILNLTRYEAPKPAEHFFGQRQLGTEIRDLYGYLIDGMQGARGTIRSGGDGASLSGDAIPPTQEPVARYSGVVKVGPDGTAKVSFDIPGFNGTLRVMAVAWTKGRAGSATADVIVRDPVVVSGTLPRFMNVGDQSRFFMDIDNVEGQPGDYALELDVRGPVIVPVSAAQSSLKLAAGQRTSLTIPVTAAGTGLTTFDIRLKGPGVDATQTFTLRIQPGTPALYRRSVKPLQPGTSLTISEDLLADFLPGTGGVSVAASPYAGIDVPALLQALDRYPYGCSEQTVSRAMPLLYVNRLATLEALAVDDKIDDRIRDAIDRVLSRQDSNGAFGLWSANSGTDDIWLDSYVTDFLTRARERGFSVPQKAVDIALDRLRNTVANASDVEEKKAPDLAYAIYVLARNGRPVMGDLRYLADTKLGSFGTALGRAQVAAALALLGDKGRAQTAFGSALELLRTTRDDRSWRPDYGSRLRDASALLALAAESGIGRGELQKASLVVEEARNASTYTSTQENAWMVLAAEAVSRDADAMALTIDGVRQTGSVYRAYKAERLEGRQVVLANGGQSVIQAVVTVAGNPLVPEPAAAQGYTLERSYWKMDGTKVEPTNVRQNDRMVVTLKVTESEAKYARLLLVDMLPAGFEIDNPNLVDGNGVTGLPWLKRDVEPAAAEYRDDRFVAAIDRTSDQPAFFTLAYIVRAVTPGRYVHPPAVVEDMYRPERFGRTGFGSVEVVGK